MTIKIIFDIMLALAVGGWVVSVLGAVLSIMAFDAPGAQGRFQAWAFMSGMCVLSLAMLAGIIAAKWLFQNERVALPLVLLAIPAALGGFFLVRKILG